MKWTHPNVSYAATLTALALSVSIGGCRGQSAGVTNPFLAEPGRVPPPGTRALAPGQAQPYYPGDPLPVMQSGTAPSADRATLAAAEAPRMPSADTNLAWNSPIQSAAPTSAQLPVAPQPAARPAPRAIASAEPAVAIPADGDSLRFELSGPQQPEPFTPIAPVPIPAPQQAAPLAAAPAATGVVNTTYSELTSSAAQPAPTPWRSPEIAVTNTPLPISPPPVAARPIAPTPIAPPLPPPPIITVHPAAQPLVPAPTSWTTNPPPTQAANIVDVQLRAVPSPPTDSIAPSAPRIRLPGPEQLPPPPSVGSNDGFRPRSSMR
jgi:hypothetical protein